jgi:hypothetical protein
MLPCEGADAQRQKVPPRRRKAPGPARPAAPSPAEALAVPLVDALTDPDEQRREAAARHVLRTCVPAVVALLCRGLVERLLAGPLEGRRSARASLEQVGAAAVPALYCRLLGARGAGTQLALVEALTAIGSGLPTRDRIDLMLDLGIVRGRAADESARQAIDRAVATLRRLNERASRPGGPPAGSEGPRQRRQGNPGREASGEQLLRALLMPARGPGVRWVRRTAGGSPAPGGRSVQQAAWPRRAAGITPPSSGPGPDPTSGPLRSRCYSALLARN